MQTCLANGLLAAVEAAAVPGGEFGGLPLDLRCVGTRFALGFFPLSACLVVLCPLFFVPRSACFAPAECSVVVVVCCFRCSCLRNVCVRVVATAGGMRRVEGEDLVCWLLADEVLGRVVRGGGDMVSCQTAETSPGVWLEAFASKERATLGSKSALRSGE